jgi:Na+-translocating ferredoxin:NAD+ oxidoreductase RnfG subunit
MKISKQQILMILLLLIIGYVYSMYSGKINEETEKEERKLIQQFLANDVNKNGFEKTISVDTYRI